MPNGVTFSKQGGMEEQKANGYVVIWKTARQAARTACPPFAALVPRAAAWRLRHAAARGLSPWRRATPGIAILVFARGQGGDGARGLFPMLL